jgi:hypothetical protein
MYTTDLRHGVFHGCGRPYGVRLKTCIGCQDGCAERRQPLLSASTAASSLGFSRRTTSMAAAQLLCLIHTVAKTGVRSADLSMTESVKSY